MYITCRNINNYGGIIYMLYSKESSGASKLSPTTDLSKLEQQINTLQTAVTALQNKVDPISATTFIGQHGQE